MPILNDSPSGGAMPVVKKSLIDMYGSSSFEDSEYPAITLYGPSGAGKSTTACTLSKFWGTKNLEDTVVVAYGHNATSALAEWGTTVDVVRVRELMFKSGIDNILTLEQAVIFPMLHEYYAQGKRVFIFDEASTRTTMMLGVLNKIAEAKAASAGKENRNKLDVWTEATALTQDYVTSALQFPESRIAFLSHSKSKEGGDVNKTDKEVQTRKRMAIDPTSAKIGLAIPGNIGEPFINDTDLLLAMRMRVSPKTGDIERYIQVFDKAEGGVTEFRTKNRYSQFLDEEEAPHLGKILDKIKEKKQAKFADTEKK